MIEARHLRAGNCIIYDGKETTLDVILFGNVLKHNWFGICEPIPITEEWLLKFGFKLTGAIYGEDHSVYSINQFEIIKDVFKNEFWSEEPLISVKRISSVHQLQNLYFALTGEELIFKIC